MTVKEIDANYKAKQNEWKAKIKAEPNKAKRFGKWLWFWFAFPWVWLWANIRDWRTAVIFVLTFITLSVEVWLPYLIYFITGSAWWLGIGSACWLFWLGPGTPFLPLCICITIGIKALFNKINNKKGAN